MSTFSGFINEINGISVDRFTEMNCESKFFFLSHCHTDHMKGLSDNLIGPLYLSEISAVIIRRLYPKLNLNILSIGQPTHITHNGNDLIVTACPAGHCPGSVMFLFQYNCKFILYTGDFRINARNLDRIKAFKDFRGETISLDCIYIDSTFLSSDYTDFPSQTESNKQIMLLIDDWLSKNENNIVVIRPPANYGYEYLFSYLAENLYKKIHIWKDVIKDYRYFPDLCKSVVGCDQENIRIHCCPSDSGPWNCLSIKCRPGLSSKFIKIIRPTAFRWNEWKKNDSLFYENDENTAFVCYSNHASYKEIKEMVEYFRPKRVEFNVLPIGSKFKNEIYSIINKFDDKVENNSLPEKIFEMNGFENILTQFENGNFEKEIPINETINEYFIKRRKKC